MIVTASLDVSTIELAAATTEPSAGTEVRRPGAVLSTRMPVRTLVELFPSESEAVARRSYSPSPRAAVLNEAVQSGRAVSVPIVVQLFAPAGLTSKTTFAASGPETSADRGTVPEMTAPGSLSETVGAVESTCTWTGAVVRWLPATSVAITRMS